MANIMLEEDIKNLMKKMPKKKSKGSNISKHIKETSKDLNGKGIDSLQTHGISLKSKY